MESYLTPQHYDLVTPDGKITDLHSIDEKRSLATVKIEEISPAFIGYELDPKQIAFNLKSTLAQLGINGIGRELHFEKPHHLAQVQVELTAIGDLGSAMLQLLSVGAYIGKLFAADDRRRVRDPDYLMRMFDRLDRKGRPLLSLKGGSSSLALEKRDGRTVAFLSLLDGILSYEADVYGFLPTLAKALKRNIPYTRQLLHLHQYWKKGDPRVLKPKEILLVKTAPLHIRTVYARVVETLLPTGMYHTSADCLQPDTAASGDIYELYGSSDRAIDNIPLEFFTLEPHREHVFFSDRDQLIAALENPKSLFEAFATAPQPKSLLATVFVVKGTQMKSLKEKDWIIREESAAQRSVEHQPTYPFLKAIESGLITSQGVLLSRHFPSPNLKQMLLNDQIQQCLKRIYFQSCSPFSHEDREMLVDLAKFHLPVFWVDENLGNVLQFTLRPGKEAGLFVPLPLVESFRKALFFGVHGSHLREGNFAKELRDLLQGVLGLRAEMDHPLLQKETPLAFFTNSLEAMEVGNRIAKSLGILSCTNLPLHELQSLPYVDATMTNQNKCPVENRMEFPLDIPIFLPGGVEVDFEYALEEMRHRATAHAPVFLFGPSDYWRRKIAARFRLNRETGDLKESEWVSNCFYCIQTAQQGLGILRQFFENKLPIGPQGPIYEEGFALSKSI